MMGRRFVLMAAIFLTWGSASAQDENATVYFNPLTLLITAGTNSLPLMAYSTIEIPRDPGSSFILSPSIWSGTYSHDDVDSYEKDKYFRLGAMAGFRMYPGGDNSGLYVQGAGSFYRFKVEDLVYGDKASGSWFDLMTYTGYVARFGALSIAADVGVGYVLISSSGNSDGSQMSTGKMLDANLMFGFSF